LQAKVAFAVGIIATVAAMLFAVIDEIDAHRHKCQVQSFENFGRDRPRFLGVHGAYIQKGSMATKQSRMHGRVEGARAQCAIPGCVAPGEFKAPLEPANFDGPGSWRFLCLNHVREHNAKYNFFEGMSPTEITDAQSPLAGWDRQSRMFGVHGADPPPKWSDFADPLDAISARFGHVRETSSSRLTKAELQALSVLGLGVDVDWHAVRKRYSQLVRRFHPDKNGGDRSHEARLRGVIEAYQLLRKSAAFA
jgi:hypothetical protein